MIQSSCTFRDNWMLSRMPLMLLEHALQGLAFRMCWEKSKTSEHNSYCDDKTAGRGRARPRSGPQISVFPRTSG